MQFRLRTLLIVLALGPMALAASYWTAREWHRLQAEAEAAKLAAQAEENEAVIEEVLRVATEQRIAQEQLNSATPSPVSPDP